MTKSKQSRKRLQSNKKRLQSKKQKKESVVSQAVKGLLKFFSLLLAVSGILFSLHPRYSVDRDETYNPLNPFENPLMITNNGYFPLSLKYSITVSNFRDIYENSFENIGRGGFTVECLNSDRKTPIELSRAINTNIPNLVVSSIDLKIDVSAQTNLFCSIKYPYVKKETINFKLRRASNGKYIWQEKNG